MSETRPAPCRPRLGGPISKMKNMPEAYAELKAAFPGTAISLGQFRQLVLSGRIPSVTVGQGGKRRHLVNMERAYVFFVSEEAERGKP